MGSIACQVCEVWKGPLAPAFCCKSFSVGFFFLQEVLNHTEKALEPNLLVAEILPSHRIFFFFSIWINLFVTVSRSYDDLFFKRLQLHPVTFIPRFLKGSVASVRSVLFLIHLLVALRISFSFLSSSC